MSVDQFTAFVRAESRKYQQVIKDLGVSAD